MNTLRHDSPLNKADGNQPVTVVFIRHGETPANALTDVGIPTKNSVDAILTDKGRQQASDVGACALVKGNVLYFSPTERAAMTAKFIMGHGKFNISLMDPLLLERVEDNVSVPPSRLPDNCHQIGDERPLPIDRKRRISMFLDKLFNAQENVFVVGHSLWIADMVGHAGVNFHISNCSATIITLKQGLIEGQPAVHIHCVNDIAHLTTPVTHTLRA